MNERGYTAIGLVGPKMEANVGGAMRAAACYGADLILLQAPRFVHRATNVTKAERHIPTIVGDICDHRPYDCPMIVVEIVEGAVALPDFEHPERGLYVFGPEDGSVPARIIEKAQHVIYVPTAYCMNLAATANVVLYDRMVKRGAYDAGILLPVHRREDLSGLRLGENAVEEQSNMAMQHISLDNSGHTH